MNETEQSIAIPHNIEQLEAQLAQMHPRPFDTYILPLFLCIYAVKSKGMRKSARRLLFGSGVYVGLRNYFEYKKIVISIMERLTFLKKEPV